ncbi:hypothetical protein GCM10027275_48000 [Rhabdobacter roseus]|uniref:DUF2157 domain-containing protein n=1 Tax=Rhabdobacter roseus TaxID=1655419 RepID=A0A840TSD7_9BACT|nr:hypothetical protein [Rhabdobacter roseus]MBB5286861.1 hypothetical protein [Rhabdobacter roseus]
MKLYPDAPLRHRYAQELAQRLHQEALLSDDQLDAIQAHHADVPYAPHFFVKVGLFLFGSLAFLFGGSFFGLFFVELLGFSICSLAYAALAGYLLVRLIRTKKLRFAGADNALLYGITGALCVPVFELYELLRLQEVWVAALVFLPVLFLIAYSTGEPVLALAALGTLCTVVFSLLLQFPLGRVLLPFAGLLLGVLVYAWTRRQLTRPGAYYWQTALEWVGLATLVVVYLCGNYGVVREANAALNGRYEAVSPEIAFAGFFWLLTFLIPLGYLYRGIRQRDRSLLLLALLGLTASVATVQYYYPWVPAAWLLVLGGTFITALAYTLIRLLQTPRLGFSYVPEVPSEVPPLIEAVVLSHTTQSLTPDTPDFQLGGGDFGGGGAGERY